MITSFTATSDTARGAVTEVAQDLRKLAANLETTSDAAKGFLMDGQKLVRDVDAKVDPLAGSFIGTMDKAQGTLAGMDGVLAERSALGYQLGQALQQLRQPPVPSGIWPIPLTSTPNPCSWARGGGGGN